MKNNSWKAYHIENDSFAETRCYARATGPQCVQSLYESNDVPVVDRVNDLVSHGCIGGPFLPQQGYLLHHTGIYLISSNGFGNAFPRGDINFTSASGRLIKSTIPPPLWFQASLGFLYIYVHEDNKEEFVEIG